MNRKQEENEVFKSAHMMILISYTLFSVLLVGESILLSWERWAIVLLVVGIILAWGLHIRQVLAPNTRLWIYSVMMMATFFFYGTHRTSAFDIAGLMAVGIMLYSMTGEKRLITLCQVSYYATFAYDIIMMLLDGEPFDVLVISRILLHIVIVTMAAWTARTIIDSWRRVLDRSEKEIGELVDATERLDNFLANVSHEIRTPINAVMGLSTVLSKEELPDGIRTNISAISGAGHRVAEQISDILDFTEIDMGKLTASHENYMIDSLVNDLLVQVSYIDDRGLDLVVDMEAQIPTELVGDESKIKKILWHLINNGFRYTNEGGVFVHIFPVERDYGINLVMEVRDTGVGMSDEEIEHIYDKFFQLESREVSTIGGLGIGIPIINGFAEAMGGFLAIDSTPGEGTTVRVSIPQDVSDPSPCLAVRDRENCIVAGFLGFMTTGYPKIREFYMEMISHLVSGLAVPFYRVQSVEELQKLVAEYRITHLFVGTGEYLENREYIETLSWKMNVALVADRGFDGEVASSILLLPKPFYGAQVARFLNHSFDAEAIRQTERISCPDVKVLVVDDEPMNLMVARGVMESYGMSVATANSGHEAIKMCDNEDYDIIFMDYMMPGMDGVEAMKRLRINASRARKEICVVALTANAISSAKEMFLSEGFDAFLSKPIEITDFERILKHVLPKTSIRYLSPEEWSRERSRDNENEKEKEETARPVSITKEQDEFSPLRRYGVDTEQGLRYCQGEKGFYREVLLKYAENKDGKLLELKNLYRGCNWKDYAIRVHSIKSISKTIGAADLSETARFLESAAKQENTEGIERMHAGFLRDYEILMDRIGILFGTEKNKTEEDEILEFLPENEDAWDDDPEGGTF